jgi:flagella basal body P-ring formation protein FlgA
MSKFNKLAALSQIAEQLEKAGHSVEAGLVHKQFMKLAQMADEMNTISTKEMTDDVLGEYNAEYDDEYRANGPAMQQATRTIQSNLKVTADALFGPSTVYAIVKALDGIAPDRTLNKDYVQRAREYVSNLPAGFVTKLKNFVGMKDEIRKLEGMPATRATDIERSDVKMKLLESLGGYTG